MKNWKKLLSILLCIVMLASLVPAQTAYAEELDEIVESLEEAYGDEETQVAPGTKKSFPMRTKILSRS